MTSPFVSEAVWPWTPWQIQTLWDPGSPGGRITVKRWWPWFRRSAFATLRECLKAYQSKHPLVTVAESFERTMEAIQNNPFWGEGTQMTMGDNAADQDEIYLRMEQHGFARARQHVERSTTLSQGLCE